MGVKMNIKVERTLDEEFVSNVLITAFDGHYGACWYWARPTRTEEESFISTSGAPNDHWTEARVHDMEDETKKFKVHAKVLETGIQRILDEDHIAESIRQYIVSAVLEDDAGHIDATAADCIVQVGLFNELVYG